RSTAWAAPTVVWPIHQWPMTQPLIQGFRLAREQALAAAVLVEYVEQRLTVGLPSRRDQAAQGENDPVDGGLVECTVGRSSSFHTALFLETTPSSDTTSTPTSRPRLASGERNGAFPRHTDRAPSEFACRPPSCCFRVVRSPAQPT